MSSLVKGQYIDISEMGLVLATQSDPKHDASKRDDSNSLDLTNLQYVRIVGTNESDNSIALQPVFIPQTWETTKKS